MKNYLVLLFFVLGINSIAFSQNETDSFKPNGKPLALIFTNFNTSFSDGVTTPAFEITRAYLGYEYNFSKEWYAKVVLDVGNPGVGSLQMTAYLKNAYFQYKKNNFKAYFGLISTTQFKVSESVWGNRYIEKSFQDAYKFNASADLGFDLEYKFCDYFSLDFSVVNGEGYKKLQGDKFLRPAIGARINPISDVTARVYVDMMGDATKQQSLATFLAYTGDKLTIAGEYNYQQNFGMVDGHDIYGTSIFANYRVSNNVKLFGRYDNLGSATLAGENDPWQLSKDGQLIIAGVECSPVKGVKLAPNFRFWDTADNSTPNTSYLYLNCEIKF